MFMHSVQAVSHTCRYACLNVFTHCPGYQSTFIMLE